MERGERWARNKQTQCTIDGKKRKDWGEVKSQEYPIPFHIPLCPFLYERLLPDYKVIQAQCGNLRSKEKLKKKTKPIILSPLSILL